MRNGRALKPIQLGKRFELQWLVGDAFEEEDPTVPVRWPEPAPLDATDVYVDFGETRLPDLLDIAVYDTVGLDGKPRGDPSINTTCTAAQGTCWQRPVGSRPALPVTLSPQKTQYIGVSASWYLPKELWRNGRRPAGALSDSAAWLFTVKVGSPR